MDKGDERNLSLPGRRATKIPLTFSADRAIENGALAAAMQQDCSKRLEDERMPVEDRAALEGRLETVGGVVDEMTIIADGVRAARDAEEFLRRGA